MPEYSVELLPSYHFGLKPMVDLFGVDRLPATVAAYHEHYLREEDTRGHVCNRKVSAVEKQSEQTTGKAGLINVEPKFVHCSLLFVNPPARKDPKQAEEQLRSFKATFVELAKKPAPKLKFSSAIRQARLERGGILHQIDAEPSPMVFNLQQSLAKLFREHGWSFRFPRQTIPGPGRLHCTLRDSRYPSEGLPIEHRSSEKHSFAVMLDKICITPAGEIPGETHVEHNRRKPCGTMFSVSFGESNEVRSSGERRTIIADFSKTRPAWQRVEKLIPEPVIHTVFHEEPARQADPSGDAVVAAMLCSAASSSFKGVKAASLTAQGAKKAVAQPFNEDATSTVDLLTKDPVHVDEEVEVPCENVHCNTASSSMECVQAASLIAQQTTEAVAEPFTGDVTGTFNLPTEDTVHVSNDVELPDKVHVGSIAFNGMKPQQYRKWLSKSEVLQQYLIPQRLLPAGTKAQFFIKPDQKDAVVSQLPKWVFCSFHVVISESVETHLLELLQRIPCRRRPRYQRENVMVYGSMHCPKGTFLDDARKLRNPGSVAQSTTEATARIPNPRRFVGM